MWSLLPMFGSKRGMARASHGLQNYSPEKAAGSIGYRTVESIATHADQPKRDNIWNTKL
jgi:hypothetical protein